MYMYESIAWINFLKQATLVLQKFETLMELPRTIKEDKEYIVKLIQEIRQLEKEQKYALKHKLEAVLDIWIHENKPSDK